MRPSLNRLGLLPASATLAAAVLACAPAAGPALDPAAPQIAQLTAEERTALRLACDAAGRPAAVQECYGLQINRLALAPRPPQLARLSADQRLRLNAVCAIAQARGPAELRRCQQRELGAGEAAQAEPALPPEAQR